MSVTQVDHAPNRPDWACRECRHPWPCLTAKADLLREFECAHLSLCLYMAMHMHDAINDASTSSVAEPMPDVYGRFLNWVPRGPTTDSVRRCLMHSDGLSDESTTI